MFAIEPEPLRLLKKRGIFSRKLEMPFFPFFKVPNDQDVRWESFVFGNFQIKWLFRIFWLKGQRYEINL